MESRFKGNIIDIREVEDCIRRTKKYAKGILSKHLVNIPIQGEEFPNKVVAEYYEVYPYMKISWDMSIIDAIIFLGGGTLCIKVYFKYNYNTDKAEMMVKDGEDAVKKLARTIPKFSDALARAIANGNGRNIT